MTQDLQAAPAALATAPPASPTTALVPGQRQEPADAAPVDTREVSKVVRRLVPCVPVLPRLLVSAAEQWATTTSGRIVSDPYSWMQAVHWVVASGCYRPAWSHGPREMGLTAIRTAQLLMELSPCRPGVDYLARRLGVTERTAQYQLAMLREAGLLAYVTKGTRGRGERAQASEFVLVIPAAFDLALGVRTAGEGSARRVVGIAEAGRAVMALLGKKAARKVRAVRAKSAAKAFSKASPAVAPVSSGGVSSQVSQDADGASAAHCRCTPMGGGCCTSSADRSTPLPPESKLAGGKPKSTAAKKSTNKGTGRKKLNRVGRRHQLAFELVQQVPWLRRALVPRIAWVVREVADAGWTWEEVAAWLTTTEAPTRGAYRPTGLLAHRLRGAAQVPGWTNPDARARAVEQWRDSRSAAKARHDTSGATDDWSLTDWQAPASRAAGRIADEAFDALLRPAVEPGEIAYVAQTQDGLPDLDRIDAATAEQLLEDAQKDPYLITLAINEFGEATARRLYTDDLVDQHLRLVTTSTHLTLLRPWETA